MTMLETELFQFEKQMDEAAALDAAQQHAAELKVAELRATLAGGRELKDPMFPTLGDLVNEFAGFGKTEVVARFMAAAARSLYAKAQAGDAEAQKDIDALEEFFLGY